MTGALRLQGTLFCALALAVVAACALLRLADGGAALAVVAVLIVVLGVPHGALDTVFARRRLGVRSVAGWVGFAAGYLLLAAGVVGIWRLAPQVFLLGFLLLSAAHFAGDPVAGTRAASRAAYAGAVLILPALFHEAEIARLFAALAGPSDGLAHALHLLAWPWAMALAGCAAIEPRRTGAELLAAGLLAAAAPPLIGFAVFFCAMHGARHILRTAADMPARALLVAGVAPMLGTLVLGACAWFWLGDIAVDARLIQVVFVGLAALTVPHMALIERARRDGWARGL